MKAKGVLFGLVMTAVLMLSAPAGAFVFNTPHPSLFEPPFGSLFDTRLLNLDATDSIPFNQSLNEGYTELSDQRSDAWIDENNWDFVDGELFKHKARTAKRNSIVLPDSPLDRDLTEAQRAEFWNALYRLENAFDRGGRFEAPRDAGVAQVKYDCWIEATEDGSAERAAACKAAFEAAMDEVEAAATYRLTEVTYIEPAQSASAAVDLPGAFHVYFDFDKSSIRSDGDEVIAEVINAALASPDKTVKMTSHADTMGTIDYNQALSERRANSVIGALISGGVDRGRIVSEPVGETRPLVDTGDQVKEQGNRVSVIELL